MSIGFGSQADDVVVSGITCGFLSNKGEGRSRLILGARSIEAIALLTLFKNLLKTKKFTCSRPDPKKITTGAIEPKPTDTGQVFKVVKKQVQP